MGSRSTVGFPVRLTVARNCSVCSGARCSGVRVLRVFGSTRDRSTVEKMTPVHRRKKTTRRSPEAINTAGRPWLIWAGRPWLPRSQQGSTGRNPKSTLSKSTKSTIRPNFAEMLQSATFESKSLRSTSKSSLTPRTRTSRHFDNFTPQMLGFSSVLPEIHKNNKYRHKTMTIDKLE